MQGILLERRSKRRLFIPRAHFWYQSASSFENRWEDKPSEVPLRKIGLREEGRLDTPQLGVPQDIPCLLNREMLDIVPEKRKKKGKGQNKQIK